jgi:hypothetical protein
METHRQRCQVCQSLQMRNILVREPGEPTVIYARCGECGELVARYRLEDYYHHGKGIESYLRSHGGAAAESGRRIMKEFQEVEAQALAGFAAAIAQLQQQGKDV